MVRKLRMMSETERHPTIEVDRSLCEGLGVCELQAPDYFEVQDDGTLEIRNSPVAIDRRDAVRSAVESCPKAALQMTNIG
jgi:ferredoxin